MAKESKYSSYPGLIFRETLRDEITVRANGGTPTDVAFSNGVGEFNGSSSKINYNLGLNGTYSVRIICNPTSFAKALVLFNCQGSNGDGVGNIQINATTGIITAGAGVTRYINGIINSQSIIGVDNEIVITNIPLTQGTGVNLSLIGSYFDNDYELLGSIDLVEIYNRTLTPSEISNLYHNNWNTKLSGLDGRIGSGDLVVNGGMEDGGTVDVSLPTSWSLYNTPNSAVKANTASNGGTGKVYSGDYSIYIEGINDSGILSNPISFVEGRRYRIEAWSYLASGTGAPELRLQRTNPAIIDFTESNSTVGSWVKLSAEAIAKTSGSAEVRINCTGATIFGYVDVLQVHELTPKTLIDFDSTKGYAEDRMVGSVDETVIDDDFSTDTSGDYGIVRGGNTWDSTNKNLIFTSNSAVTDFHGISRLGVMEVGKKYSVQFKAKSDTEIVNFSSIGDIAKVGTVYKNPNLTAEYQNYHTEFVATTTTFYLLALSLMLVGSTIEFDDIIIQEIRQDLDLTSITFPKIGVNRAALFNGTDSKIDTGTTLEGFTQAKTIMGWINPKSMGEGNNGVILVNDNGASKFWLATYQNRIECSSNVSYVYSNVNSILLNKLQFIAITINSIGTANIFISDEDTPPTLSGSADQDSGTPVSGTTNVIIGNIDAQTRTFDGTIPKLKVVEGILSLEEITQFWSNTLKHIK